MTTRRATTSVPVCKFFLEGTCTRGSNCRYLHSNRAASSGQVECRYFRAGYCARGAACQFIHSYETISPSRPIRKEKASIETKTRIIGAGIEYEYATEKKSQTHLESSSRGHLHPSELRRSTQRSNEDNDGYFYGAPGEQGDPNMRQAKTQKNEALDYSKILAAETALPQYSSAGSRGAARHSSDAERCPFFAAGYCRFGDKCKKIHTEADRAPDSTAKEVAASFEKTCGICMEPVLETNSRFGLMMGCSCILCLDCVREWRANREEQFAIENVRRCPTCRVPSFFVIPCNRYLPNGPEKSSVVAGYLQAMKSKPCRYFAESRECPYGSSCFYRHENVDGTEHVHQPRIKQSASGTRTGVGDAKLCDFL